MRLSLEASLEHQRPLAIRATPATGVFPRILPAAPVRATRFSLTADRPTSLSVLGTELRATGELRFSHLTTDDPNLPLSASNVGRLFATLSVERPFEQSRLVLQTWGGVVLAHGDVVPQELLHFGGPVSAPGYAFHELASLAGVSQRVEWRMRIPAPSIDLGRFGRVPGSATLAPFLQATLVDQPLPTTVDRPKGVYPSAGVALHPFFDLLRLQLARGLRHGGWSFNVDVTKDFWAIL
jgi:hypothetical protein